MPIFVLPLAFLGMLAVPAAAAIYLLRNRSRRLPVSSLMLWADQQRAREGGLVVQRLQAPILLILELLAIASLVMAATNPRIRRSQAHRPLVVVLDDSYSMQAGGENSPRKRAEQALKDYLDDNPDYPVQFILAGRVPQALGEPIYAESRLSAQLKQWRCMSPSSDLQAAVALAGAIGQSDARLLVLTDRKPTSEPGKGRLEWWSFSRRRPNVAFINATRTPGTDHGRCLLEIANLSTRRQKTTLIVRGLDGPDKPRRMDLDLDAGRTHRLVLKVPAGAGTLRANLSATSDSLAIDNEVILLPEPQGKVRVDLRIGDETIRKALIRAFKATGKAVITNRRAELVITDRPGAVAADPATWTVRFIVEPDAAAYVGPFVLDYSHPLTEGLSLEGVVWGAGKSAKMPGLPVITAGNVPLVTDVERPGGAHQLHIRLRPDLSTLLNCSNWPILVWNLLRYRASSNFGLDRTNVRLGANVVFRPRPGAENLRIVLPDGSAANPTIRGKTVTIPAGLAGVHEIRTSKGACSFASNALSRDESDLARCAEGKWGNWLDETTLRTEYKSIAWVFLLLALAALAGHMAIAAGRRGGPVA